MENAKPEFLKVDSGESGVPLTALLTLLILLGVAGCDQNASRAKPPDGSGLIVNDGFETSSDSAKDIGERYVLSGNPTMLAVSSHAREGENSVVSHIDFRESRVPYRTELVPKDVESGEVNFDFGKDYWIGFSIFIDESYVFIEHDSIVLQFHNSPDEGENSLNPPMALNLDEGIWSLVTRWDGREKTERPYQGQETYKLSPVQRGKWIDIVLHARWEYEQYGILELWIDGERELEHVAPNAYKDEKGVFMKFGTYRYWYKTHKPNGEAEGRSTIYFDALRIGTKGYDQVKPR